MSATKRELLEERWSVLMLDVARFKGEAAISGINSSRYTRITDTLEELAASLVDEVWDDETDTLMTVISDIWDVIEDRLIAWAEQTEARRAAERAGAAA